MIFIQQNGWNLFAEKDLLALGTASQWIQSSLKNIWMNIKSLQNGIMRKFLAAWAYPAVFPAILQSQEHAVE